MISRKTSISAAALLLAWTGAAAAFPATATTDLNVRAGPGTGYRVIDQLDAGDTVEVTGRSGSWYRTAEGGWASAAFLDPEGGGTAYIGGGSDYGSVAFYYDDNPYYWDDAGFYFFIDGGRRHRVGWDWFRDRDHRNFRWSHARHRQHFEDRWGRYGGRQARGDRDGDDDGRRFRRGDADVEESRRIRRGDADVSAGASVEERRMRRGGGDAEQLRTGRSAADRGMEGPPRAAAGDQPVETRGPAVGGGGRGGGGGGPAIVPQGGGRGGGGGGARGGGY